MNKESKPNLTEEQLQEAWERVLRGEQVSGETVDLPTRESAEILRSQAIWGQMNADVEPVSELERERIWKRLSAEIIPEAGGEVKYLFSKQPPKSFHQRKQARWWMGIAAGLAVAVLAVQLWQFQQGVYETDYVFEEEEVWITKGSQSRGLAIYEQIQAENPTAYAEKMREDLLEAGFQVMPLEQKNEEYLLRLQAGGDVSETMQRVLDQYDLVLGHKGEANLRIGR